MILSQLPCPSGEDNLAVPASRQRQTIMCSAGRLPVPYAMRMSCHASCATASAAMKAGLGEVFAAHIQLGHKLDLSMEVDNRHRAIQRGSHTKVLLAHQPHQAVLVSCLTTRRTPFSQIGCPVC